MAVSFDTRDLISCMQVKFTVRAAPLKFSSGLH